MINKFRCEVGCATSSLPATLTCLTVYLEGSTGLEPVMGESKSPVLPITLRTYIYLVVSIGSIPMLSTLVVLYQQPLLTGNDCVIS